MGYILGWFVIGPALFALVTAGILKFFKTETSFKKLFLYAWAVWFIINLIKTIIFPEQFNPNN